MNLKEKTIGIAITGSFYNLENTINELKKIIKLQANIIPIMSNTAYSLDTRYGKAKDFINKIEHITKNKIIHTIQEAELLEFKNIVDIMAVVPTTSNTIAKLANDIIDNSVTVAVKSSLRVEKPIVLAVACDDGLSAASENIGKLLNRRNYYFVPFKQINPITKPRAITFDSSYLIKTIEYALDGEQIQPILLGI